LLVVGIVIQNSRYPIGQVFERAVIIIKAKNSAVQLDRAGLALVSRQKDIPEIVLAGEEEQIAFRRGKVRALPI
jgi:hypothetical protein